MVSNMHIQSSESYQHILEFRKNMEKLYFEGACFVSWRIVYSSKLHEILMSCSVYVLWCNWSGRNANYNSR